MEKKLPLTFLKWSYKVMCLKSCANIVGILNVVSHWARWKKETKRKSICRFLGTYPVFIFKKTIKLQRMTRKWEDIFKCSLLLTRFCPFGLILSHDTINRQEGYKDYRKHECGTLPSIVATNIKETPSLSLKAECQTSQLMQHRCSQKAQAWADAKCPHKLFMLLSESQTEARCSRMLLSRSSPLTLGQTSEHANTQTPPIQHFLL